LNFNPKASKTADPNFQSVVDRVRFSIPLDTLYVILEIKITLPGLDQTIAYVYFAQMQQTVKIQQSNTK